MAEYVPRKNGSSPRVLRIQVGKKSLKLAVYENENTINLYMGGMRLYCIDAFIHKPESVFVKMGLNNSSEGLISHLYYNSECSLEYNFQKGFDTRAILEILISYIRNTYPFVEILSFTDASHKVCDNGYTVELSEMSYVRTGKTWYETHFYAYMDKKDRQVFEQAEEKFQTLKKIYTWDMMLNFIQSDMDIPGIQELYEKTTTWQEFFGQLSQDIGIADFCIFVSPWLHRFLSITLKYNFSSAKYIIPLDKIKNISYTEEPFVRGGKRFTYKKIKTRPRDYKEAT